MTTHTFSSIIGTTQSFTAASDVLSLSGDASTFTMAEDGSGNTIVTDTSGNSATLAGFLLSQITTSNVTTTGASSVIAGDNATATTSDDLPQVASGPLDLVAAAAANLDANNLLFGLGEGDVITSGAGDNLIFGGKGIVDSLDGSDTITIDGTGTTSGSNRIYGNAGNDTVLFTDPTGAGETTSVWGGLGADDIISGAAAGTLVLSGNAGSDTINGSGATGAMTIYGGDGAVDSSDGADFLISGLGNAQVFGNAGDDNMDFDDFISTAAQTLYGGLGNDTIDGDAGGAGSAGSLEVYGNAGTDTLDVSTHLGAVTLFGGDAIVDTADGADTITVGAANASHKAVVYGNAGDDSITSTAALASGESITVYGGLGVDVLSFSGARDAASVLSLFGNAGNDVFNINDAALTADATTTFSDFESTDVLNVTLAGGTATDLQVTGLGASASINNGAANGNYVFTSYTGNFSATNLVLSDASVLATNFGGTALSISGTAGADQLIAGAAGDTLGGAAGADKLIGGDGADSITGGDGVDTVDGGEGNDTIDAGAGGADGGGADSSIDGGEGADNITGGAFEDSIDGGTGNDTIAGGADSDSITGGIGDDTFAYAVAEVDATDTNVDLIADAFTGADTFNFTDLTLANLRGTGVTFASGNGTAGQALGANVGLYVATNAAASFTEANIYTALSGIADDFAAADIVYVMVSNGTDARLVRITEVANPGTLVAADDTMEFVARLTGADTTDLTALTAGNFDNFT